MKTVTLGGDRLGSGNRNKIKMHGFERSSHNLSSIFRSSMAAGTLVPCMVKVALPGDTFDIHLDMDVKTHPTIGPLFGSYKCEIDVFQCPLRLYQGKLHNNAIGIGLNMANIKLPLITVYAGEVDSADFGDPDNAQINPSCLLSYLGLRGVGFNTGSIQPRDFNAIPLLAYWDIYKNYYANKQEQVGAVINTARQAIVTSITTATITNPGGSPIALPNDLTSTAPIPIGPGSQVTLNYSGGTPPIPNQIRVNQNGTIVNLLTLFGNFVDTGTLVRGVFLNGLTPTAITGWEYISASDAPLLAPAVDFFSLTNIDTMRNNILAHAPNNTPFNVNEQDLMPYETVAIPQVTPVITDLRYINTQQGLGLKTYQSDLFNNWLLTDWIDGPGGINDISAVDTSSGSFTMDVLIMARKVYDMLNRIAMSGGTYYDWIVSVYDHEPFTGIESPVYHGGLIKELVFQEVVSNAASADGDATQPLGTLAGKGIMAKKHKGGTVRIKVNEHSYIIAIVSLTPRVDYSQGNNWDINLKTMDDFHKPGLDGIGFQELITEQMAWWSTRWDGGGWETKSAGKQPAWINYMTEVNRTYGNFAIQNNEMFMTLNRRYEFDSVTEDISDLTTYIDPSKFNFIFAQTSIDAQNFWVQIAMDVTARRKMSAKVMPNL